MWVAPTPVYIVFAVAIIGAGIGISMPSVDAAVTDIVPVQYRAEALSIRNSTTFFGRAIGPVLFVSLAAVVGYHPVLLVGGIIALGVGLLAVFATSRKKGGDIELPVENA